MEQSGAEPRLEVANRAGHGCWGTPEPPRGFGKAATFGNLDEGANAGDSIHIVPNIAIIMCKQRALSLFLK
jgi:hypothetical protein